MGAFLTLFAQRAKQDSHLTSFWWWLGIDISKNKGFFVVIVKAELHYNGNELSAVNIFVLTMCPFSHQYRTM